MELEAVRSAGRAVAAVVREGREYALLPLVLRVHPEYEVRDAASPYGYPGFLAGGSMGFARAALTAVKELLASHGIVCAFVRQHTLLSPNVPTEAGETVVEHGPTVCLDLSRAEDQVFAEYRSTTRNLVRRLRRDGFVAHVDRWSDFDSFQRLYRSTMERVAASEDYFFSPEYFEGLRVALGPRLHLCTVELEGTVACAGLFSVCSGIGQYYLSGTDPGFARASPTRLMIDEMWRRLRLCGCEWLNLGGGLAGADDNLFKFKAAFSQGRAPFRTLRIVCDDDRYRSAVALWEADAGRPACGKRGFFPAYRAPIGIRGESDA